MKGDRILTITSFINEDDSVIDVGSDHGYISINLKEQYPSMNILATDISSNALSYAINNIKNKNLDIKTMVTDGLKDIDLSLYDTVIIAGMGTSTILNILSIDLDNIKRLIIQSNNELELLRSSVVKLGFCFNDNKIVKDNDKYYEVMEFIKSEQRNKKDELIYGFLKPEYKVYYEHLMNKYHLIMKKLPSGSHEKKFQLVDKINFYKKFISKI